MLPCRVVEARMNRRDAIPMLGLGAAVTFRPHLAEPARTFLNGSGPFRPRRIVSYPCLPPWRDRSLYRRANPSHVAIGHVCCLDDPKAEIPIALAKRGVFVGFGRVTIQLVPDAQKATTIMAMVEAGHAGSAMLRQILVDNPRRFLAFVPASA